MDRSKLLIFAALIFAGFAVSGARGEAYQGKAAFNPQDLAVERRAGFDLVRLEGAYSLDQAGAPALPVIQVNVALPRGATVRAVEVSGVDLEEVPGSFDIMPVAEAIHCSAAPAADPFRKDQGIYGRDGLYPGIYAERLDRWELVGQPFVTLRLHPLQYNPVQGRLFLARAIAYEVVYDPGDNTPQKTYNFSEVTKRHYEETLKGMAVNPEHVAPPADYVPGAISVLDPGSYEYVIVTTTSFAPHFQDLADWRTQMGMPAKIVDLSWIYTNYTGGSDPEKIRNFVIDAHATWGTPFFLLGGDTGHVPKHDRNISGEIIPNDTYYADYDDNWKYEVFVGRACVNDANDIDNFVGKVLTYEKNPPDNFGNKIFFMGFNLDASTPAEKCKETIKEKWMPPHNVYVREYDSEPGGHESDVKGYMNDGQNLVNHCDHASTSIIGVGSGYLDIPEAKSFTNGTRYCNFKTIGCWAGNYPSTCWGEALVGDDQGGITFVGNSRYGWYNPGLTDTLSMRYDMRYCQVFMTGNVSEAGDILARTCNGIYPYNGTMKYIYVELNLLGDPALHVWTDNPVDLTATYDGTIYTGYQTFTVHVQSGGADLKKARICVMKDGEVYAYGTTNSSGLLDLIIEPLTTGTMTLTVTANNHKYYEDQITVQPSTNPPPEITGIAPRCGTEAGGTGLTVSGNKFTLNPAMTVRIGGEECLNVTVLDPNTLACTAPAGKEGWRDVEVSNANGSGLLPEGFLYFPTGGPPYNAMDIHSESVNAPAEGTLIASGLPQEAFAVFYSLGGGPTPTAWGAMGLDVPFSMILLSTLGTEGSALIPLKLPAGYGPLDLYLHLLGVDGAGQYVWSYGGNNPNGSGSIWIHLNN